MSTQTQQCNIRDYCKVCHQKEYVEATREPRWRASGHNHKNRTARHNIDGQSQTRRSICYAAEERAQGFGAGVEMRQLVTCKCARKLSGQVPYGQSLKDAVP